MINGDRDEHALKHTDLPKPQRTCIQTHGREYPGREGLESNGVPMPERLHPIMPESKPPTWFRKHCWGLAVTTLR